MTKSEILFDLAQQYIPGGVNSPVRAFKGVGKRPVFIEKGEGAYLFDVDGKKYIDYIGSWGALAVGHVHPEVVKQVSHTLAHGFGFGAPTEIEVTLAQTVCRLMPSMEMVRFVNSGTEATMSAIRLARGFTGRDKIIKFAGCYHGHSDSLLVAAGSGGLTFGVPNSAGVPASIAGHTLVAPFNDLNYVEQLFAEHSQDIACIIIEPIAGNMNFITPKAGFLQGLQALCERHGSLLILDEVMTGFRVGLGGAQAHYQIKPDLTVLGKIVGGGFPVGAFGGRRDVMQAIAPLGPVYQAGTLSGNPVAMSAGLATLSLVSQPGFYERLSATTSALMQGLSLAATSAGIPLLTKSIGGMFGFFFTDAKDVQSETDAKACDLELFKRFFHAMLEKGVYFAPSAFEAGFVSSAHTQVEVDMTIKAATQVFAALR